jgi:hypothetical protein
MYTLKIPYSEELLLALKETPEKFEVEARLLLTVKLYEMGGVSTGRATESPAWGASHFC